MRLNESTDDLIEKVKLCSSMGELEMNMVIDLDDLLNISKALLIAYLNTKEECFSKIRNSLWEILNET